MRISSLCGVVAALGTCFFVNCSHVETEGPTGEGGASGGQSGATSGETGGASGTGGAGEGGAADKNECETNPSPCDVHATCTDLFGGYQCECASGFSGTGERDRCADIDECNDGSNDCDPAASCTNAPGTFSCACPLGFTDANGDGTSCIPSSRLGEDCATPFPVNAAALPGKFEGDTTTATLDLSYGDGQCSGGATGGAASGDHVYLLIPDLSGDYTFRLTSAGFDANLYVVTDCGAVAGHCIGAANSSCADCTESLPVTLDAGVAYYVVVDGSSDTSNDAGAYTLEIIRPADFEHPIQLDVSAALTHDTVLNNGSGSFDPSQDLIDRWSTFVTQSVATLYNPGNIGLPDNAFFPRNADHPDVKLHWSNAENGVNSRFMVAGNSFSFDVPTMVYSQVQVIGTGTMQNAPMVFTLTYADGSSDVRSYLMQDWYQDSPQANGFVLINDMVRFGGGNLDPVRDPAVYGVNLDPDPTKPLASVGLMKPPPEDGVVTYYVFFGAVGW